MTQFNKPVEVVQLVALRDGMATCVGKSEKYKVQGKEVKVSEILGSLDALIADVQAAAAAREVYRAAVEAADVRRRQLRPLLVNVRTQLRATLSAADLATCGLSAKHGSRDLTADQRVAKLAKLRATREANGTRGAAQRRADKAKAVIAGVFVPSVVGEQPAPNGALAPPAATSTAPEDGHSDTVMNGAGGDTH